MSRRLLAGLASLSGALVAGGAVLASTAHPRPAAWLIFTHLLPPASFFAVGLILWNHRPGARIGLLMMVAGAAWLVPWIGFVHMPVPFTISDITQSLYEVPLAHLAIGFPTGRLRSRSDRALVIGIWTWFVANNLAYEFLWDPRMDPGATPSWARNVLLIHASPGALQDVKSVQFVVSMLLIGLVSATLVRHWARASGPGKRALAPMLWALVPTAGYVVLQEASDQLPTAVDRWTSTIGPVILAALPIAMLFGIARSRWSLGAVSDLVLQLSEGPEPGSLREALARTLRDPSVQLAYRVEGVDGYVDADGRPVEIPRPGAGRATTSLEGGHRELAVLIHDEALVEEAELVAGVGAAVRLALENERLQAEVRAQLEEVRASRARILHAGDTERQRIERNLHDGAQQRLLTVSLAIRMAQSQADSSDPALAETLRAAGEEVREALEELRELAGGLHPMALTRSGLAAAVRSLADRASIPVELSDLPTDRLPPEVEAAAYYVVSEALANAGKYSSASRVSVAIQRSNGALVVRVADDGVGGADTSKGSGLTGLADRVAVLGGTLSVLSPSGAGTTLVAGIPCPS